MCEKQEGDGETDDEKSEDTTNQEQIFVISLTPEADTRRREKTGVIETTFRLHQVPKFRVDVRPLTV